MLPNQRVITRRDQRGHVEGMTNMPPSTADRAATPRIFPLSRFSGATPTKKRNLLPCASPQFRQAAQQGVRGVGTNPGNALQDAVLVTPSRAFLDPPFDVLVHGLDLSIEELQNGVDALADRRRRGVGQTVALGRAHLHQLTMTSQFFLQLPRHFRRATGGPAVGSPRQSVPIPGHPGGRSSPIAPWPWRNREPGGG